MSAQAEAAAATSRAAALEERLRVIETRAAAAAAVSAGALPMDCGIWCFKGKGGYSILQPIYNQFNCDFRSNILTSSQLQPSFRELWLHPLRIRARWRDNCRNLLGIVVECCAGVETEKLAFSS